MTVGRNRSTGSAIKVNVVGAALSISSRAGVAGISAPSHSARELVDG